MSGHTRRPVAVVTGARQGLGRATAVRLAEAGFDVVAVDIASDADETLAAIGSGGGRGAFVRADIGAADAAGDTADAFWDAFGHVDVLVNNAGLASRPLTDVLEITPDAYDRVLDVNLRGTFFLSQAVANRMIREDTSSFPRSIVMVTSIAARMVNVLRAPYHLSKAGLSILTELLAVRLAEHGIGVYEVRPGYMRTEMTDSGDPGPLDASIRAGRVPQRRWGTPDDVAATIATLARGELPFSTGQAIWVDGGLHVNRAD